MKNNEDNEILVSHEGIEKLKTKKEIFDFMLNYDSQLKADKHFILEITIKHRDKSLFILQNVHLQEDDIKIYIYTEHCGFFYLYKGDLEEMREVEYNKKLKKWDIIKDKKTIFDED